VADHNLLSPWIRRFLLEHLVAERNLARNTQKSYRDTLALLLPFVSDRSGTAIDRLSVDHLSAAAVRAFLEHVERERRCSVATRNQRLGAIHSLARFIGTRAPEHLAWCTELRSIPFKKTAKTIIGYLEKPELDALLQEPDRRTPLGARDHALLLFLYNTGARADEAARLQASNLQLGTSASVRILGKGNRWRVCPLWPATAAVLRPMVIHAGPGDPVFRGRTGGALTRFGVHRLVAAYGKAAAIRAPTLATKRVSPHTLRHYVAPRTM
jgi:integrase/recombinase XerD